VNGSFSCKPYDQATLASPGVMVLLKNLSVQQRLLDLGERQIFRLAFNLGMQTIDIFVSTNPRPDVFDVHTSGFTF
jgi:hypothetical protein